MKIAKFALYAGAVCALSITAFGQWVRQTVETKASFRGLSVVSEKVVWASGTGGTVIRTIDGGATWNVIAVPEAAKLDFRDIEAFDENTAYILSIGNGDSSRIYKTTDGGATWKQQFVGTQKETFFDAIACWDKNNCLAMSDPVGGHYYLIATKDGETWAPVVSNKMAATIDGEAAFAASGTCLIAHGKTNAFIVSGGDAARVFKSTDRGVTWSVVNSPIVYGTSGSGIFSIAMWDAKNGVIVGGNYEKPTENKSNLAFTADGGTTWTAAKGLFGYRSGVSYVDSKHIVAVGSGGSDMSTDGGKTWTNIDKLNWNAVQAKGKKAVWAVGASGLVAVMK
ncbi:MAG: glycosyl hydrolase [Pyrinomonadaceae bacterium]